MVTFEPAVINWLCRTTNADAFQGEQHRRCRPAHRSSARLTCAFICTGNGCRSPVLSSSSRWRRRGAAAGSRISLAEQRPLMRLTWPTHSFVNALRSREMRRWSSSSGGGTRSMATTRGSPPSIGEQRAQHRSYRRHYRLGPPPSGRGRNRGRINGVTFDPLCLQHAMDPAAVEPASWITMIESFARSGLRLALDLGNRSSTPVMSPAVRF